MVISLCFIHFFFSWHKAIIYMVIRVMMMKTNLSCPPLFPFPRQFALRAHTMQFAVCLCMWFYEDSSLRKLNKCLHSERDNIFIPTDVRVAGCAWFCLPFRVLCVSFILSISYSTLWMKEHDVNVAHYAENGITLINRIVA